jgi:hypothetical protein
MLTSRDPNDQHLISMQLKAQNIPNSVDHVGSTRRLICIQKVGTPAIMIEVFQTYSCSAKKIS